MCAGVVNFSKEMLGGACQPSMRTKTCPHLCRGSRLQSLRGFAASAACIGQSEETHCFSEASATLA